MRAAIMLGAALAVVQPVSEPPLFTAAAGVHVGRGSGTVRAADVNGDGHPDLLTRHLLQKTVAIQLGDGRGGFAARPGGPLSFDYEPGDLVVADLNGDGAADLAITPGMLDVVDVLLGSGTGNFVRVPGSPFTVTEAREQLSKRTLRAIDINEDGHLDLVTGNGRRRNTFGVLFGDGRGGFVRGAEVALDSQRDGYVFAFADVNGDRHLDVVSASRAGYDDGAPGRVIVRFGDGKGRFPPSSQSPLDTAAGPRALALALDDVDGDGRPDIAITNREGRLSVLLNDGRGAFASAPGSPFALGVDGHSLVTADLNRDGRTDLICANVDAVDVFVWNGRTFAAAPGSPYRAGPGAYSATLADLNGDGKPDIAASSFGGERVTLLLRR